MSAVSLSSFSNPFFQQISVTPIPEKQNCGLYERVLGCFHRKTALECSLGEISTAQELPKNWQERFISSFHTAEYANVRHLLRSILIRLDTSQLQQVFEKLMQEAMDHCSTTALDRCLNLFTEKELRERLTNTLSESEMDVLMKAIVSTPQQQRKVEKNTRQVHSRLLSIPRFFHQLLDTMLMAFRFFEIGRETGSSFEASHMLTVYATLFALPFNVLPALLVITGSPALAVGIVVGSVLSVISLLYVYVKWLKPCPQHINGCNNFTAEAKRGELSPVLARSKEIQEVIDALLAGPRNHPLLRGVSGVGKTEIVKGLALEIAEGKIPQLKGMQIFSIDSSQLITTNSFGEANDAADKLQRILHRIRSHKDKVILFFDEFHAITASPMLPDRFKRVLDANPDSPPYCIAATTDLEYQKLAADPALLNRFHEIHVDSMNKEQTMEVLRGMMACDAPELEIDEEALEAIWEQTKEQAQPSASKSLLGQLISKTRSREATEVQKQIAFKRSQQEALGPMTWQLPEKEKKAALEQLARLDREIKELEVEEERYNTKFSYLDCLLKFKVEQKNRRDQLAIEAQKNGETADVRTRFLFLETVFLKVIQRHVDQLSTELARPTLKSLV